MPNIEDMIQRLEAASFRFHPPAAPEAIRAIEATLGCALPPEIAALYRHGDGMERFSPDDYRASGIEEAANVFRLMSTAEAIEMHPHLVEWGLNAFGRRAFFTDDESNEAAVYLEGPLQGRVCVIYHDDPDPAPVYRSIISFLGATASCGKRGFLDEPTPNPDYPSLAPLSPEETQADLAAIEGLRPLFATAEKDAVRQGYAFGILALVPFERTDDLLPFLEDEDMYIQAKACDILGLRRYEPAIPRLAEVALQGRGNGETAAILALGSIGTAPALRELVRVYEMLPASKASGIGYLFEKAFVACGCEIDYRNRRKPQYREPGADTWKPLRTY